METKMTDMSGEQLLLTKILGDAEAQAAVETELDRRARQSLPGTGRRRHVGAKAIPSPGSQLAA